MSFASPILPQIPRQSIVGMEGMWAKMFDPPTESPETPELLAPTNPVPEVMAAAGFQDTPTVAHTVQRQLMHGMNMATWDNRAGGLEFFTFRDKDNPATGGGNFPAPTIRMPRGVVFHAETVGSGPPPHTIHWHGIEPTPINDGVGHCSMEIGQYKYQWQPNFMGSYFYHCHRNTVQHFEFGLYGDLLIGPSDAYFASIASINPDGSVVLNNTPIGASRDGKRRVAANLANFPQFPGWNSNLIDAPDPEADNTNLPAWLKFQTDPHAMTVPYDVEAIWVFDDRDSRWSDLAKDARATYPAFGTIPGVNDNFSGNAGGQVAPTGFFAFNDFHADYWFVTGVPFPGPRGSSAAIPAGIVIPPALNSGISGSQVSINAQVGQTILIRALSASYNTCLITLPVDAVIIAADGRAFGVPPFGQYNHAFLLPANTPIRLSVARRGDALIRVNSPVDSFATVQFIDTRSGETPGSPGPVLFTGRIPFKIGTMPGNREISGTVVASQDGQPISGVQMNLTGATAQMVFSDTSGNYSFAGLPDGLFTVTPSHRDFRFSPAGRQIVVSGANVIGQFFTGRRI